MTILPRQYFHSHLANKDIERISGMARSHSKQEKSEVMHPDHSLMLKLCALASSHTAMQRALSTVLCTLDTSEGLRLFPDNEASGAAWCPVTPFFPLSQRAG